MKVGDTVKLKPAMWQGIKPESYGLSFTGEYIIDRYVSGDYPNIWLKGFSGIWDAGAFQVVVKEEEKEVNKFKVGDEVVINKTEWQEHGLSSPANYNLRFENTYRVERTTATLIWVDGSHTSFHYDFFKSAENDSIERPVLKERKVGKIRMELFDEGFPNAILEVAKVMSWANQHKGYKDHDWVNLPDADSAFSAAASRHKLKGIIQKLDGVEALQRTDEESNILHKAHEAFNVLAELELMLRGVIK